MDTLLILPSRFVTNEGAVSKLAIFVTTPGQDISAVNLFHSKLVCYYKLMREIKALNHSGTVQTLRTSQGVFEFINTND